jgi:hypothetical protein
MAVTGVGQRERDAHGLIIERHSTDDNLDLTDRLAAPYTRFFPLGQRNHRAFSPPLLMSAQTTLDIGCGQECSSSMLGRSTIPGGCSLTRARRSAPSGKG